MKLHCNCNKLILKIWFCCNKVKGKAAKHKKTEPEHMDVDETGGIEETTGI